MGKAVRLDKFLADSGAGNLTLFIKKSIFRREWSR